MKTKPELNDHALDEDFAALRSLGRDAHEARIARATLGLETRLLARLRDVAAESRSVWSALTAPALRYAAVLVCAVLLLVTLIPPSRTEQSHEAALVDAWFDLAGLNPSDLLEARP